MHGEGSAISPSVVTSRRLITWVSVLVGGQMVSP